MNLPIYSNLKAKLESKGLDSITSGQIAWFVCSLLCSAILYHSLMILGFIMYGASGGFYRCSLDQLAFIIFLVFVFNLFYLRVRNAIFLIFSFLLYSYIIVFHNEWLYYINICILCILLFVCSIKRIFVINALLIGVGCTFSHIFFSLIYSLSR